MSYFINLIIKLFTSYSSLFNFYTLELSSDISFFQFINCLILIFIFCFIFFRFLIKRYTFKIVFFFILKRIFLSFFFFFIFLFSGFIYCETPVNKSIKSILNTDNKKYLFITVASVTGCYVAYNIPFLYTKIKDYSQYKTYLDSKIEYPLSYKLSIEYFNLEQLKFNSIKKVNTFNIQSEKFNSIFIDFVINYNNSKINLLKDNLQIQDVNKLFRKKYLSLSMGDEFNGKILKIIENYEQSLKLINELQISKQIYHVNLETLEIIHSMHLSHIATLIDLYESDIFIFNSNFSSYINMDLKLKNDMWSENGEITIKLNELENLIDLTTYSSNQLLSSIESIPTYPLLSDFLENNFIIQEFQNPLTLKIIDKGLESQFNNLDSLKFISINLGYIIFYPILYCSNKIFGTVNPLSSKIFKKAIWFFFSFGGWGLN